ncbi:MAG: prepilin-type N-terminal cleavage/methylation domain-containing protein [Candidatus Omnitrophica bacterium]|nr:prepilin-type N-terminal cleavage/methylation domain-containing protein [Candidatus Omnitrophota bacterium]MCB9769745.1 prepilin-type N-terminal cleavage/methylation domain-containing protein [Candidatus Omnitrophota bacterium]
MKKRGFTLIELLIVIAIILILIAIALPNFLEAQVRAKVTNANAELRTLETAMASYFTERGRHMADGFEMMQVGIDPSGGYPAGGEGSNIIYSQLTTPVAYVTDIPVDEFQVARSAVDSAGNGAGARSEALTHYRVYSEGWKCAAAGGSFNGESCNGNLTFDPEQLYLGNWIFLSPGPNGQHNYGEWAMARTVIQEGSPRTYNPTNGTRSHGDIVKWGK